MPTFYLKKIPCNDQRRPAAHLVKVTMEHLKGQSHTHAKFVMGLVKSISGQICCGCTLVTA